MNLIFKIFFNKKLFLILATALLMVFLSSCSFTGLRLDMSYIFKTDPEKAVIDFLKALNNKDSDFIYESLLSEDDKNNISREKFNKELSLILSDIESLEIEKTYYLGYEGDFVKVVSEFHVKYVNGEVKNYRKYIYLFEENKNWKLVFDKSFI